MKDNRGFTLIEILGVVVIIAAISLLAFPPIIEQIRKSHSKISGATLDLVYTGADLYIDSEKGNYWKNSGNTYCITLRSIVDKGFLNDPITDTMTNQTLDLDSSVVKAVYSNNKFQYSLVTDGSCVEEKSVITFTEKMTDNSEVMDNDPDHNLRYVGQDPDNYVWFNNELWRIIGVFDGQAKIIKNDFYNESIAWDGVYSLNNWATAFLQNELNGPNFLGNIQLNDPISYGYIDINHVWNIGAVSNDDNFSWTREILYNAERSDIPAGSEGALSKWTGAIGLMYPSDYAYSTSATDNECSNSSMYEWDGSGVISNCKNNSWLYSSGKYQWTLTTRGNYYNDVFYMYGSGYINYGSVFNSFTVRPALYLNVKVGIIDGTGKRNDPFILDWIKA